MAHVDRGKMKVALLGDAGVGKSSLIDRYVLDDFHIHYDTTIGIDFFSKSLISDKFMTRLQIWDTAGQERFRSLIPTYIRDINITIIVYDVTSCVSISLIYLFFIFFFFFVRG